jgi:hypothetical protein
MPNATVPAAATGLPEDIYARCAELEYGLRCARNMATILADIITDSLLPGDRDDRESDLVYVEATRSEAIDFAAKDVVERLRALENAAEAMRVTMVDVRFGVAP